MNYLKTGRRETSRFPFLPPAKNVYLCARTDSEFQHVETQKSCVSL
ncbi:hypothetical protein Barb6XT_01631 [Bacteroidales bacterium Barb6XT]|nr:hypothetical protein Barb6XT_01631 [Bacteroidales bacterium Barb6XT]